MHTADTAITKATDATDGLVSTVIDRDRYLFVLTGWDLGVGMFSTCSLIACFLLIMLFVVI